MEGLKKLSVILVIVGAINVGLIGALGVDVIESIVGSVDSLNQVIQILIGASGVWMLMDFKKYAK